MTKIIAGRASKHLATRLCKDLGLHQIEAFVECYQDQELRVQLAESTYDDDIIIVQSTSKPANDNLMELLLLVDAAKRSGAKRIVTCVPYFGYSRQDHSS